MTTRIKDEFAAARVRWEPLSLYENFEHVIVLGLTFILALIVTFGMNFTAIRTGASAPEG